MAVPTKSNTVQPLSWQRPIVTPGGAATDEFQRAWAQQARVNASVPDLTTAAAASAVLDLISSAPGSLLARGASAWGGLASPSDATKFLNGSATPSWAQVTDADLLLSDITTNNVSTTKHGFAPKAPNDATKFLDGTGAYSTPSSGGGVSSVYDDGTTLEFALTDPSGQLILDPSGNPIFAPIVLPASALPTPGASSLGGVESLAAVSHKFLTSITTAGLPVAAQPQASDLSDYASTTWIPTDVSGASLTLTINSATYVHIGNVYFCTFDITFPVTASGANVEIGGLPATVSGRIILPVVSSALASPCDVLPNTGTSQFEIYTSALSQIVNSTLSGARILGCAAFTH